MSPVSLTRKALSLFHAAQSFQLIMLCEQPGSISVWRSVRDGGDTKNRKSRRTLALPLRAVEALRRHQGLQQQDREQAGAAWRDSGLVFTTSKGTALDAANVRRGFRQIVKRAGLVRLDWTPRELRHSFVSLLSDDGVVSP